MKEIVKRYEKVTDFAVNAENLLLHFENLDLRLNNQLITTGLSARSYELQHDYVFYVPGRGTTAVYEIGTQRTHTFDHGYQLKSYVDGVAVVRKDDEAFFDVSIPGGETRHAYSLRSGGGGSAFSRNYIVHPLYEQNKLEQLLCFDRAAQRYTWSYDVKAIGYRDDIKAGVEYTGEVKSILGFYRDIVIVALKGEKLLALDVNTGSLRWRVDFVEGATPAFMPAPRLLMASDFKIVPETGELISFYRNIYIALDLETGKIKSLVNAFNDFLNSDKALIHSNWYKKDSMIYYFTGGLRRGTLPQIIAYDLARKEVAWTQVFEGNSTNPDFAQYSLQTMQYHDGYFYVLDRNNILTVLKN